MNNDSYDVNVVGGSNAALCAGLAALDQGVHMNLSSCFDIKIE